jgi:GNAT superfamily N-acetyltransferase
MPSGRCRPADVARPMREDGAMPTPEHPHADGTVRLAVPADAEPIARIQAEAWQVHYAALLPSEATDAFDIETAATSWAEAISAPPSRRHRVFVAVGQTDVVGFAAASPATDTDLNPESDAELLALHIAPDHTRRGHASRLMAAVVDHARDDGVARLVTWVFAADDPMRLFLRENGWDADGSTRDLDVGELLHQVRLHTGISDPPDLIA